MRDAREYGVNREPEECLGSGLNHNAVYTRLSSLPTHLINRETGYEDRQAHVQLGVT